MLAFLPCLSLLLLSNSPVEQIGKLYIIPQQTLSLYKIIGEESIADTTTIKEFQISGFVTLKEYKEYLTAIRKDSGEKYYTSQLPDTNIGTREIWQKYISDPIYDDYPALGVSWENAMNYCRWKTLRDNSGSLNFIYRLPNCSEWLAAYSYLKANKVENDLNKNYSDWLLNYFDESYGDNNKNLPKEWPHDNWYCYKKNDPKVLKRKEIIGNSYLYQYERLLHGPGYGYAREGYRQIGFRYVKDYNKESNVLKYWGMDSK